MSSHCLCRTESACVLSSILIIIFKNKNPIIPAYMFIAKCASTHVIFSSKREIEKILFQKEKCRWDTELSAMVWQVSFIPVCALGAVCIIETPWACDRSLWRRRRRHSSLPCRAFYLFIVFFFPIFAGIAFTWMEKLQNVVGIIWKRKNGTQGWRIFGRNACWRCCATTLTN